MIVDLVVRKSLKAAALFHPTFMTAEDAPAIKASGVSVLFICAEQEHIFVPELRQKFEEELKGTTCKFIEYPGTEHGFGIRPSGEQAAKSGQEAHANTIAWFKETTA
jgi:dienelactone hydrolase